VYRHLRGTALSRLVEGVLLRLSFTTLIRIDRDSKGHS
jgi:hypothetical protein